MKKSHRAFWLFMTALFVLTGVVVGVYAFWVNTHPSNNLISCARVTHEPNQQPGSDGKLKNAKLAGFTPPQHYDYLKCTDFKIGSGAQATSLTQTALVQYVGALASSGKIFDDSFDAGQAASFALNQVVPGFGNGILGMKVGGIRRIYIPAQYGYGNQAIAGIPANSDLVFDVQLLHVR